MLYDGLGQKYRKTITTNGSVTLTQDYLEGIELKNNVVEAVYNEEGRAYNNGGSYRYEYVLRDHLGNTRLVFTDKDGLGSIDNSEILSESHYYPFSRRMDGAWYSDASAAPYRYQYNGKELVEEFNLNFYDYGARWYDPSVSSWWQIDLLTEVSRRWSPYVYALNNPIRFIDPDGMDAASVAVCPTCPKGAEYDQYRESPSLYTFDNQTGIVLTGNGIGPTVYGRRDPMFAPTSYDPFATLTTNSSSTFLSQSEYRQRPTGFQRLEPTLTGANSAYSRAGSGLSVSELALKRTANGLRNGGRFTSAYIARIANVRAIAQLGRGLGAVGLAINGALLYTKYENGTIKPSDYAGLALNGAFFAAGIVIAGPVGLAVATISVAYTIADESGALDGLKEDFDRALEK